MEYLIGVFLVATVYFLWRIANGLELKQGKSTEAIEYVHDASKEDDLDEKVELRISEMFSEYPSGLSATTELHIQEGRRAYYKRFTNEVFSMDFPLFSEKEITWERLVCEESRIKFHDFWNQLPLAESDEVKKFDSSGGNKSDFKLSDKVLGIVQGIISENKTSEYQQSRCRKMIEANIQVSCGVEISKQEDLYYKSVEKIPSFSFIHDKDVKKEALDFLNERQKHCIESWEKKLTMSDEDGIRL